MTQQELCDICIRRYKNEPYHHLYTQNDLFEAMSVLCGKSIEECPLKDVDDEKHVMTVEKYTKEYQTVKDKFPDIFNERLKHAIKVGMVKDVV